MKKLFTTIGMILLITTLSLPASTRVRSATQYITYTVNSAADPGDGVCNATNCTLREAIITAINPGNVDNYITININFYGTIVLKAPLPAISDVPQQVNIYGSNQGPRTIISGDNKYQIFTVDYGAVLFLNRLIISNAHSTSAGAALRNSGVVLVQNSTFAHNTSTLNGGAIYSTGAGGSLIASNTTFSYNNADVGGAIYGDGLWIQLLYSTFDHNIAISQGGAIAQVHGDTTVVNSTFNANSAPFGAALYDNALGHAFTVRSSTITGNSVTFSGGGAVHIDSGSITMMNTIAANTTGGGTNCHGTINNYGNNLDSGTSCGWGAANHSLSSANPQLDPLSNYGGPTQTMRLKLTSPAIDAATFNSVDMVFEPRDQRGKPRPADGDGDGINVYDIGAYEVIEQAFLPLIVR